MSRIVGAGCPRMLVGADVHLLLEHLRALRDQHTSGEEANVSGRLPDTQNKTVLVIILRGVGDELAEVIQEVLALLELLDGA